MTDSTIRGQDGELVALRVELDDLRRRLEVAEARNAALEATAAGFDELAAVAAHDLKSPITKILAFARMLEEDVDRLGEEAAENLHYLVVGAEDMRDLVDQLLAWTRSGRESFELEEVDVAVCVRDALEPLTPRVRETKARIASDRLPTVRAGRQQLVRLFRNLIDNALLYSGEGAPVVRVTASRDSDGWVLGVRDGGPGIASEHAERVFEPFQRLVGKSEAPGTGLGLAISRRIVERHGGRIWVEPGPDGGAHVRFRLGAGAPSGSKQN